MKISDIDEILVQLYLRLNGYFTTGLILHSPTWGQSNSEIDCLAIRHAHHSQQDRRVAISDFLSPQNRKMDFLICEVKNDTSNIKFNDPIKNNLEVVCSFLLWSGIFHKTQVNSISKRIQPLFQDDIDINTVILGVEEENVIIRPLLCCPPMLDESENKWCLNGKEIFNYANLCFNPDHRRDSCSTRYNFQQWGYPFSKVVTFFKNSKVADINIENLYDYMNAK